MTYLKTYFSVFFLFLFVGFDLNAQSNLAEKLGYQPDDKLLIIHADDLGVAHAENIASVLAIKIGMVNSGSIMMPCPWVAEIADCVQKNPKLDFGLHLTLTSEWKYMKWNPVAPLDQVRSLVDSLGFFYADCMEFSKHAKTKEVEIELRAQIEQAYRMGIKPTHLDTHMGCLIFTSPEVFEVYLKLGREYKIPVMVGRFFLQSISNDFKKLIKEEDIIIEKILTASISDYESGLEDYYTNLLTDLSSGINILLIHTAFDDAEMQALTIDHPHWGAKWRQEDFDFFTSEKCKKILEEEDIKLITWRQIQDAVFGN
jgi:predicted glycoside hydrolase/deacetylase ChbG (UPF0249 family)